MASFSVHQSSPGVCDTTNLIYNVLYCTCVLFVLYVLVQLAAGFFAHIICQPKKQQKN